MKRFTVLGHKVNVCQDIEEWGRTFYDIPDDIDFSSLDNRQELESECMGFACPEDKEMWLFIPRDYKSNDLSETIAHELGHLMTFKSDDHEKRAEHYEGFYKMVIRIRSRVERIVTEGVEG
jgi:hypothetical protein